ncbi:hypothetical protein ANN_00026 [Periplaneta americana]|uniref:DDE-1 domain-containing protein n=1 Tax=Periplaneta americana TaxID=6978 RepID=A0ABQ8TRX2_PERAM|nr:hypothetical protein ANN_00026 [Periplaneta americana]
MAGKKWYYAFKRRRPQLNFRQPESTSFARAKGFDKESVRHFFDTFQKIVDVNQLDSTRVFNVVEIGLSTVLENGAPPGTIFADNPESGYINKDVFVRWLRHFIDTVLPSKEREVLLLPDGHSTHTRNLDALDIARENGVIMLALRGHTTHRLQSPVESLPVDAATLVPKWQVSLDEISPISNKISLERNANKAEKMIMITSSPYKQILEEVKSKQLKGDVLKILHWRSQPKPNCRFLQMVQRDVILTRSHGIVASVAMA